MLYNAAHLILSRSNLDSEEPDEKLIKLAIQVAEEVLKDLNASTLYRAKTHIFIARMTALVAVYCEFIADNNAAPIFILAQRGNDMIGPSVNP